MVERGPVARVKRQRVPVAPGLSAPRAQFLDQPRIERHVAAPVAGLRRLERAADQRAADQDGRVRPVEPQVTPPERDQLRPSEPGRGQEPEQQLPLGADHPQEGVELLAAAGGCYHSVATSSPDWAVGLPSGGFSMRWAGVDSNLRPTDYELRVRRGALVC